MRISEIVVLGCLLGSASWAADESEIYVRIQDYSSVSPKTRAKALAFADLILERAGVSLVWLDCSPSLAGAMSGHCKPEPTARDIILRLMSEKMAAAVAMEGRYLGYALVPRRGLGTFASVFVDKTRIAAAEATSERSVVLGHAIAHEIAHLLIGKPEHSSQGLMKATWSRPELLRAMASPMELSAGEARLIVRNLRQRRLRVRADESQLARIKTPTKPERPRLILARDSSKRMTR